MDENQGARMWVTGKRVAVDVVVMVSLVEVVGGSLWRCRLRGTEAQ